MDLHEKLEAIASPAAVAVEAAAAPLAMIEAEAILPAARGAGTMLVAQRRLRDAKMHEDRRPIDSGVDVGSGEPHARFRFA
jgi:hypothetical protein